MRLKDVEGHTAILQILRAIHEHEGLAIRELLGQIEASQSSALRSVDQLILMGLLAESKMTTFPFRRELCLTKKGKEVARRVLEISNIIEGENRTERPRKK